MHRSSLAALLLLLALAPQVHADPCAGWMQLAPADAPSARWAHAMAFDSIRGRAVLFGGRPPGLTPDLYDETWEWDGTNWSQKFPAHVPAARSGQAMTFDSKRGVVVMVGGFDGSIGLSDLWTWDGTDWSNPVPQGTPNVPLGRVGAVLAYDSMRDRTVLYGGKNQGVSPDADCSDALWEWDGAAWTKIALSPSAEVAAETLGCNVGLQGYYDEARGVTTVTNDQRTVDLAPGFPDVLSPASARFVRSLGTAVYDSKAESGFLFFGGNEDPNQTNQTYVSRRPPGATDFEDLGTEAGPSPRYSSGVAYDTVRGQVVVFGGRIDDRSNIPDADNQTWLFHFAPPVIDTGPLGHQTGPCLENQLHVVARTDGNGVGPFTYQWRKYTQHGIAPVEDGFRISGATTDTLVIDPFRPEDAGTYTALVSNACGTTESAPAPITLADAYWEQTGPLPSPRSYIDLAYDTARERMVSFGGRTIFTDFTVLNFGDTIERVGTMWTQVAPSGPSPAPRSAYALAYDPVHGVTVLHGGMSLGGLPTFDRTYYGDTWAWDGTSWTLLTTSGPGARAEHKMIWDAARQRIVLLGGTSGGGSRLDDLWEWDGTTWTPRATAGDPTYGLPYGRYDHGLAYDADRNVIVLHGGYSNPGGETWELTGSQWQRRAVADPGGAVDNPLYHPNHHGMTYHSSRGKTLLAASPLGNTSEDPLLTITFWEWQPGGSWRQLPGIPPWRVSPALGYDPVRKATVLSGGDFGCLPGGSANDCSRSDTWEWKYFEYDPTCGAVACGDGIVDAPEECDGGPCCSDTCTVLPLGGECNATCGDGIVGPGEACDDGATPGVGCCTDGCIFVPVGEHCGDPCRPAVCEPTGPSLDCGEAAPPLAGCTTATSALAYLPGEGMLVTPDQSVRLTIPANAGAGRTYAIAGGLTASQFGVGTADSRVIVAQLTPAGATFDPPALLTFQWPDANDDGIVDGTTIPEDTLRIYKDGQGLTPTCGDMPANECDMAPGCCDPASNTITVPVTSFSEFVVVSEPSAVTTTTTTPPSTTTTFPACSTVRCVIEQAVTGPACGDEAIPEKILKKLDRAVSRVESAPGQPEKKVGRLYRSARRLLKKASKAVDKATLGKRPKVSPECAMALQSAIATAVGLLGF